ncbi:hypothetical protein AR158_c071R [Paramecium bursaria Chlorella virus AR158]|uniref:hypothetical protein n=1 Tax=Paramecium bursaria Chlorella virus AR158 TaxID=380598 RepID=UPI00015AA77A|nr:hypothetical protein AR158_c071R [Paramecium bursaria Chlorella virus AR158]ABU43617.1 hypothetical protein AR158_c071R [Paramecium bursaria Chlorella virus AR158]
MPWSSRDGADCIVGCIISRLKRCSTQVAGIGRDTKFLRHMTTSQRTKKSVYSRRTSVRKHIARHQQRWPRHLIKTPSSSRP